MTNTSLSDRLAAPSTRRVIQVGALTAAAGAIVLASVDGSPLTTAAVMIVAGLGLVALKISLVALVAGQRSSLAQQAASNAARSADRVVGALDELRARVGDDTVARMHDLEAQAFERHGELDQRLARIESWLSQDRKRSDAAMAEFSAFRHEIAFWRDEIEALRRSN